MNLVDGMEAFVKIADLGSFAAAARELNISPSAVSKLVGKTEEELGARLLNRNTRGLSLTQEGEMFLERCRMILNELKSAKEELSSISSEPRGNKEDTCPLEQTDFISVNKYAYRDGTDGTHSRKDGIGHGKGDLAHGDTQRAERNGKEYNGGQKERDLTAYGLGIGIAIQGGDTGNLEAPGNKENEIGNHDLAPLTPMTPSIRVTTNTIRRISG